MCAVRCSAGGITTVLPDTDLFAFLGGFTAAEDHFSALGNAFAFRVALGGSDREMCDLFRERLGIGRVACYAGRRAGYEDTAIFTVKTLPDLVDVVVPFMDEFLPPSHKRQQFEVWRAQLLTYWENAARRVRDCAAEGCTERRRARGLCRRHYFDRYRR